MNSGLVMEVKSKYSIVLCNQNFYKVTNKKGMQEGEVILFVEEDVYKESSVFANIYKYASVAAALLFLLVISTTYYSNNLAVYSVVTMDINPSVEVELNKNDEVVGVKAMNEDGLSFENLNLKGLTIEEAIDLLLASAKDEGYIKEDETTYVVFTTVQLDDVDTAKPQKLKAKIEASLDANDTLAEVSITVASASKEKLKEAQDTDTPLALLVFEDEIDLNEVTSVREFFEDEDYETIIDKVGGEIVKRVKTNSNTNSASVELNGKNSDDQKSDNKKDENSSFENRNDLNELIIKLELIITQYGKNEAYSSEIEAINAYLEITEEGDYDFEPHKKAGQALLKKLREAGLKISSEDEDEDDDKSEVIEAEEVKDDNEDSEDDPDEDAEELLADLQELIGKIETVSDQSEQANAYVLRANEAIASGETLTYKELKEEGKALVKSLREEGIKVSDDEDDADDEIEGDDDKDDDKEDKEDKDKGNSSDHSNNGNNDKGNNGNKGKGNN